MFFFLARFESRERQSIKAGKKTSDACCCVTHLGRRLLLEYHKPCDVRFLIVPSSSSAIIPLSFSPSLTLFLHHAPKHKMKHSTNVVYSNFSIAINQWLSPSAWKEINSFFLFSEHFFLRSMILISFTTEAQFFGGSSSSSACCSNIQLC